MANIPDGAYIEIVERTPRPSDKVIVPNQVRINGTPLLTPPDQEIVVHEVTTSLHEPVKVTLTLFARRVEFKSEAQDA